MTTKIVLLSALVLSLCLSCASRKPRIIVLEKDRSSFILEQYMKADSILFSGKKIKQDEEILKAFIMCYHEWTHIDSLLQECLQHGDEFQEQQFSPWR